MEGRTGRSSVANNGGRNAGFVVQDIIPGLQWFIMIRRCCYGDWFWPRQPFHSMLWSLQFRQTVTMSSRTNSTSTAHCCRLLTSLFAFFSHHLQLLLHQIVSKFHFSEKATIRGYWCQKWASPEEIFCCWQGEIYRLQSRFASNLLICPLHVFGKLKVAMLANWPWCVEFVAAQRLLAKLELRCVWKFVVNVAVSFGWLVSCCPDYGEDLNRIWVALGYCQILQFACVLLKICKILQIWTIFFLLVVC